MRNGHEIAFSNGMCLGHLRGGALCLRDKSLATVGAMANSTGNPGGESPIPKTTLPGIVGGTIAVLSLGTILLRGLPLHSVGWEGCSRITVSKLGENWGIELTDPGEIEAFKSYGRRGHYQTMQKTGYGYHLYVGDANNLTSYYVHGDCIGDMPGGSIQSVFVPAKEGFRDFF